MLGELVVKSTGKLRRMEIKFGKNIQKFQNKDGHKGT